MKIYITGLPSGYEVEHLARLFYPMAPLTLTPPEPAEDCLWAEKTDTGLRVLVRRGEKGKTLEAGGAGRRNPGVCPCQPDL